MGNTVSEKQRLVNEAAKAISEMAHGTTLTHLVLADMLEELPRSQGYYGMITRLKRELQQEHGVFLATEVRLGYKVAEPGTEIDIPDTKCKRATNQYVRAVKEMQYIHIDRITDSLKKERTLRIAQNRASILGLLKLGNEGGQKAIEA